MVVKFAEKGLQRCYEKHAEAVKRWGVKVARRYVQRVNILYAIRSAGELATFPQLRFHPLKGAPQGEYALDLDNFWRLIVSFENDAKTIVQIEEVSKHYGD